MAHHMVRPRWMWSGVVVALIGACLLALWAMTWHPITGLAGAALLAAGGLTTTWAGALYDTHNRRPVRGEIEDLRDDRSHQGTAPGDMVDDPRIRENAAKTSRRHKMVRRAAQRAPRPALQALGGWLLLGGAAALALTQGWYPHTPTGQENAVRSLLVAVVVALAALRTLLAQQPGRVSSGLAATAGVATIVLALSTDHDRHAFVYVELVAGSWILLAALLTLDRPKDADATSAESSALPDATPPAPHPGRPARPARTLRRVHLFLLTSSTITAIALPSRRPSTAAPRPASPGAFSRHSYRAPVGPVPANYPGAAGQQPSQRARNDQFSLTRSVVALLIIIVSTGWVLRHRRCRPIGGERAIPEPLQSLRYRVPVGQDPAAVIDTLRRAGYQVVRDEVPTRIQDLLITSPSGASLDRSKVRATIERAPLDLAGAPAPPHQIRFVDEPGTDPRLS